MERNQQESSGDRQDCVVIGVDTHKHVHVAAAINAMGGTLATLTIPTDSGGFTQLVSWAVSFGRIHAFGIEGTGSYGASLASFVLRQGYRVIEVNRPDRRLRRLNGKSDTLDAENAARAVWAGLAEAVPKTADGTAEMLRQLKIAHDTAVKERAATMVTLKTVLVHAPEELRQAVTSKSQLQLARHLAALRPRGLDTPDDAARHTLRSLAKRWLYLDAEAGALSKQIKELVARAAPQLLNAFGIGADTAAEILIVVGDNPNRIRSEAALAKLAGVSPIPASSGQTTGRHRLNRGGHRQLNAALYRTVIVRMQFHEPTIAYVARRITEGKTKRDIIRCLKRYVIREVYKLLQPARRTPQLAA